jgi:transposase-like protein
MKRKTFSATVKVRAVIEAIRGEKTMNEIASAYGVHPNQLGQWKKQALEGLPNIFTDGRSRQRKDDESQRDRLYQQIGRLQVELDWLKKKSGISD